MKTNFKLIIKEVGINGLIAIKNDMQKSGSNSFYKFLKKGDNWLIHSIIYNHLTMVKNFAQYT